MNLQRCCQLRFKFTRHSLERAKQRGISIDEIKLALEYPDCIRNSIIGRKKYIKKLNRKFLIVIVEEKESYFLIITVFKTSKKEC